jgi:FKBP-type peptidyl-prolyl cis-trans isomerase (trigger factor)
MQVSIEATGAIGRRMTVALPADRFESEYNARIQRLGRSARLPGFRPGKAPLKLVEAQFGGKISDEVLGELMRASFNEAVSQHGLRLAGDPTFQRGMHLRGQDVQYTAIFEIYPQVSQLDIAGQKIEKLIVSITDADVERTIQSLREQRRMTREGGETVLPEIDEGFARSLGVASGSVEQLRSEVRANLERERNERVRVHIRDQVFDALLRVNPIEVPEMLVAEEARRVMLATRDMLVSQGVPPDRLPDDSSAFRDSARRRVALGIVVAELVRARGMRPDPARVRARVEALSQGYESPQEFIDWHFAEPGRLRDVEAQVLEDAVVDTLIETAQVIEKPMSFEELTRPTVAAT